MIDDKDVNKIIENIIQELNRLMFIDDFDTKSISLRIMLKKQLEPFLNNI